VVVRGVAECLDILQWAVTRAYVPGTDGDLSLSLSLSLSHGTCNQDGVCSCQQAVEHVLEPATVINTVVGLVCRASA
jgi:hypothetical protein